MPYVYKDTLCQCNKIIRLGSLKEHKKTGTPPLCDSYMSVSPLVELLSKNIGIQRAPSCIQTAAIPIKITVTIKYSVM
jgi:hypothetical protein